MSKHDLMRIDSQAFVSLPSATQRAIRRGNGEIIKDVYLTTLKEEGRAYLTNNILQNAGALTTLEEQFNKIAPSGAQRYKRIVDAFCVSSSDAIEKL